MCLLKEDKQHFLFLLQQLSNDWSVDLGSLVLRTP